MTLRDILNAVLAESGFLEKNAYVGSSDPDDKQMVAIANRVAQEIMKFCDWSDLRKTHQIVFTAPTSTSPLPTDFLSMASNSVWETDGSKPVDFPVAPNRWFQYKYSSLTDSGIVRMRIVGDNLEFEPSVELPKDISFEYISNSPIESAGGVRQEFFLQDSDVFVLDDETLIKGIQAKWGKAKMMPQADEWKSDYYTTMNKAKGRDTGAQTIGGVDKRSTHRGPPYYPLWRT